MHWSAGEEAALRFGGVRLCIVFYSKILVMFSNFTPSDR
jgi:hypothetical protein